MNALKRSLLIKAGHDNGWEVVEKESADKVVLASALHSNRVSIGLGPENGWFLQFSGPAMGAEQEVLVKSDHQLVDVLRQAAVQIDRLRDTLVQHYTSRVDEAMSGIEDCSTEVERLVKQRVGQYIYRQALMDYWGGACAVTGIAVPALLRASHAKAWACCTTDAERLNVYNGFLLCVHLDALFDEYLLSFDSEGWSILSTSVPVAVLRSLGLPERFKLRKCTVHHQPFLEWHREQMARKADGVDG